MGDIIVKHLEHDGTVVTAFEPENLQWELNKGENGPHSINYEISRSRNIVYPGFVVPYQHDFELWIGSDLIMSGPLVQHDIESDAEFVSLGGKDWLHLLERRFWPFDPSNILANRIGTADTNDLPYAYAELGKDSALIIKDMLDMIGTDTNALDLTYTLLAIGHAIESFTIDILDQENIYSKIQTLSQEDPGEFDFWVEPDKEFKIVAPRQYDIGVVDDPFLAEHIFDSSTPESGLSKVSFSNTGAAQTRLRGQGENASTTLTDVQEYVPASNAFRLLENNAVFGDVTDTNRVSRLTRNKMLLEVNPRHDITIEVVPDSIANFWTRFRPGVAIWLIAYLDSWTIESAQEIITMSPTVDDSGNRLVSMKLNQIYSAVAL